MRNLLLIVSLLLSNTYCFAQDAIRARRRSSRPAPETSRVFAESSWAMTWPYNSAFSSIERILAGNVRKSFKATASKVLSFARSRSDPGGEIEFAMKRLRSAD